MGVISISLPISVDGKFRIRDAKAAKRLVEELEKIGERVTPIDDLFGIWADEPERVKEVDSFRLKQQKKAFDAAFGTWSDRDAKEVDESLREIRRQNSGRDKRSRA